MAPSPAQRRRWRGLEAAEPAASGLFNTNSVAFQLFVSSSPIQRVPAETVPSAFTWHRPRSVGKKEKTPLRFPLVYCHGNQAAAGGDVQTVTQGKFFLFLFFSLGSVVWTPEEALLSLWAFFILEFSTKIPLLTTCHRRNEVKLQIYFFILSSLLQGCHLLF